LSENKNILLIKIWLNFLSRAYFLKILMARFSFFFLLYNEDEVLLGSFVGPGNPDGHGHLRRWMQLFQAPPTGALLFSRFW
jgi:hypothetical protein